MPPRHALGLRDLDREFGETALAVEGDLPGWLRGTLLRNGPGRFSIDGNCTVNHWFDGLALARRFRLDGESNRASFAARFLRSEEYATVREEGRLARGQFGTDPYEDVFERLGRVLSPAPTDNASVGFERVGEAFRAVTETPRAVAVDPGTLESGPTVDRAEETEATLVVAHPHRDPRRGEAVAVGARLGWTSEYLLLRRDAGDPAFERFGSLQRSRPAYLHSFGLTGGHVAFLESPFRIEPLDLLGEGAVRDAFEWTDADSRLLAFDRDTGEHVATGVADPCFAFHHVNAFERPVEGDGDAAAELVVDLIAYDDAGIVEALTLDALRDPEATLPAGELRRYCLPLPEGSGSAVEVETTVERLHGGPVEFPTVDYGRVNGRPYRYVYAAGNRERPARSLPNRLCKIDLESGTTDVWEREGCFPGEPIFVPKGPPEVDVDADAGMPEGNRREGPQDEGVVLAVVLDTDHPAPVDESGARSFLLVLDAGSFAERARAPLPCALPFGFHGQFLRDGVPFVRSMA
ncbi:MAG: carotenoid oxygenase family protein [Haloferacaceae archaeon]